MILKLIKSLQSFNQASPTYSILTQLTLHSMSWQLNRFQSSKSNLLNSDEIFSKVHGKWTTQGFNQASPTYSILTQLFKENRSKRWKGFNQASPTYSILTLVKEQPCVLRSWSFNQASPTYSILTRSQD